MGKVWNYVFIASALVIFLRFAGIPTGADAIFNLMGITFTPGGNVGNVTTSSTGFYNTLFQLSGDLKGILVALTAAAAGIAIGFATKAKFENIILLPLITTTLVIYLQTFVGLMQYTISLGQYWITAIIIILLLPFTIGFILALAEFFRGSD